MMLYNLRRHFAVVTAKLILRLPTLNPRNRLLIVKPDAIGDYILFRNYLEAITKSAKFHNYDLYLLGNERYKDIAEHFDKLAFKNFFWINRFKFKNCIEERIRLAAKLRLKRFEYCIYFCHSREFDIDYFLNSYQIAKIKIASKGDLAAITENEKAQSDKYYDFLIEVPNETSFEFERNRYFASKILEVDLNKTELKLEYVKSVQKQNYIVIAPGAGAKERIWDPIKFASIIDYIYNKHKIDNFVITGISSEQYLSDKITNNLKSKAKIILYIGNLSIVNLIDLIANSKMLIANESSSIHIAAATKAKAICISNGNHFLRFNPYPESYKIITLYPNDDFDNKTLQDQIAHECSIESPFSIENITVEKVIKAIDSLIKLE